MHVTGTSLLHLLMSCYGFLHLFARMEPPGTTSDITPFLHLAGVPSVDLKYVFDENVSIWKLHYYSLPISSGGHFKPMSISCIYPQLSVLRHIFAVRNLVRRPHAPFFPLRAVWQFVLQDQCCSRGISQMHLGWKGLILLVFRVLRVDLSYTCQKHH